MTTSFRTPAPRINYPRRDVVVETLASELFVKPSSAHQLLYGRDALNHRTATAIRAFQRHGALDRLAHWAAPIRAVLDMVAVVPLTKEFVRDVQILDLEEDVIEAMYMADPSDANAKKWLGLIDRCVGALMRLRASIVAKHPNLERQ